MQYRSWRPADCDVYLRYAVTTSCTPYRVLTPLRLLQIIAQPHSFIIKEI